MNTLLSNIARLFRKVRALFPSKLPTGLTEFYAWADSIMSDFDLPTNNVESVRFGLASMITTLGPTVASKAKYYFVLNIRASCAKQVAGHVFYEIKMSQKAAQLEAERKNAEATAQQVVAPDVPVSG